MCQCIIVTTYVNKTMKNTTSHKYTNHGAQKKDTSAMISVNSFESQHGGSSCYTANDSSYYFR